MLFGGEHPGHAERRQCLGRVHDLLDLQTDRGQRIGDRHRVGALADELDPLHLVDDAGHDQREDALWLNGTPTNATELLELVLVELEAQRGQLRRELRARPRRVVRHEAQCVPCLPEPRDRLRRTGNRLAGDVQDPVDVQENARHGP